MIGGNANLYQQENEDATGSCDAPASRSGPGGVTSKRRESGRRTALVTGASSGIGAAFASVFARHGYDLVLAARRRQRLHDLAVSMHSLHGTACLPIELDLSEPGAAGFLHQRLIEHGVGVDALVNNAGRGLVASFEDSSWRVNQDFIQLMVVAPVELAHLLLPGMRERRFGRMINVASVAGLLPGGPAGSLYRPAKSFLIRFSEMLWVPNPADNVHVTAICPGFVLSEFHDGLPEGPKRPARPNQIWLDAGAVARSGYRAVERNKPVVVLGRAYRAAAALGRLLPEGLLRRLETRADAT